MSGCGGQPGIGEALVDVLLNGAQSGTWLGRGLGLSGGEQRGEDPVVDFGVEDGEGQPVGGQVVGASYRNIIRASLILDAQFLVLLLPVIYRFNNRGQLASVPVFTRGLDLLSALYASQRLPLPLQGVLLVGY